MNRSSRYNTGSILGITLVYMLIFTSVGFAALTMARHFRIEIQKNAQLLQSHYNAESIVNLALWRMNQGADSQATFSHPLGSAGFNDTTYHLSVVGTDRQQSTFLNLLLEQDFPFDHGLAFVDGPLDTSTFSITVLSSHNIQRFDHLPKIDTTYFQEQAVAVYNAGQTTFQDTLEPGIHFVRKGTVFLKNGAFLEGTLVVLGKLKIVGSNVVIRAGTDSAGVYHPALIVADSTADVSTTPGIQIYGGIFSTGPFEMKGGVLTGPLVGPSFTLKSNLVINDQGNEQYYVFPPGFGEFKSYDWPKFVRAGSWSFGS